MIAIKGMELPKSCAECGFVTDDMLGDATCVLLCDEWKDNENHRAENCPLVEDVVEREKIDKAIEEIEAESYSEHIDGADCDDILIVELRDVLEILKRHIGEKNERVHR